MVNLHYGLGIDLQHLETFVEVAKVGSFTQAAVNLTVEQPAVSKKIGDLERKLDVILFDRKPVKLTQAGEALLKEVQPLLSCLEQTIQLAQKIGRGEKGFLKVGFTTSIANSILPDILNIFNQDYPEVEINCRQMASDRQIQELQNNQIDVVLFHANNRAISDNNLDFLAILTEPLVLVLPENHPLSTESKIPLEILTQEDFVLPTRQSFSGLAEEIHRLFAQVGLVPKIVQEATNMVTVLGLVAGGMGISLLPSNVFNLQRKGVIYREIEGLTANIKTMMVWQRNNSSKILERFREVTKSVTQTNSHPFTRDLVSSQKSSFLSKKMFLH